MLLIDLAIITVFLLLRVLKPISVPGILKLYSSHFLSNKPKADSQ